MKPNLFLTLAISLVFSTATSGAAPAKTLDDVRVFAVYEPVFTQQDVTLLTRVQPDFICRGWFKWHNTPDWQRYAPLAQACANNGILLQGGITIAAVYPGENGMDDATFRDFATHGTDGQPFHVRSETPGGGWYHLSLYNPKVIEYLKRESRLQIDAGAIGIWYDEIEGYYDWNPTEGYDPYACAAFRDWLIRKYCDAQGWRDDDPRWHTRFGIDLAKHNNSIRSFDYLRHLQTTPGKNGKPLSDNPAQGHPRAWATSANPLYREWGFAWDRKAAGTFRFDTVAAFFADLLADAEHHARERHGRTLINTYNHNGTARPGVAFLQPHHGAQPPLRKNRLDGRASYLDYYEGVIADVVEIVPGQPVVFFVDWPGETDRLVALPRSDQTHFFSLYIPEAYAAGGEFALPLRGYSYLATRQGTLAYLARMADFYREHAPFLRGSQPTPVQPEAPERLTLRVRTSPAGTAVHLVNHAFSTRDIWPLPRTNLCVTVPWPHPAPTTAFAVSPDFPEQRPVAFSLKDGSLALEVGTLTSSAIILMPNPGTLRPVTGRAADGTHILAPQGRALAIARNDRFTLWLSPDTTEIECLETGERLPARDNAAFAPPPSGGFESGLLLDEFGIPIRHAPVAEGSAHRTDAWGRYRIPAAKPAAFTAWQRLNAKTDLNLSGFWGNWSDKTHTPGVITLTPETHVSRTNTLRCTFSPTPRVSWSNINSQHFPTADIDALEVTYAGDGTPRIVFATLHAGPRFYRAALPLESKAWRTTRFALTDFRDENGTAFDPASHTGNITFQLAPAALGDSPATLWVSSVAAVTDTPVRRLWQSDAPFDTVDVENLRERHQPQQPPPAVATREPLVRFTDPEKNFLANWDGKGFPDTQQMVIAERVTPAGAPPFLRVTLPAGECSWGNANIPLPAAKLKGQDGLALRVRSVPADADIRLALHVMSAGQNTFYIADAESDRAWSDVILTWDDFRAHNGKPFDPASEAHVNIQICRPHGTLRTQYVIDLETIDAFKAQ